MKLFSASTRKRLRNLLAYGLVLPLLRRYRRRPDNRNFSRISEVLSQVPFSFGMLMRYQFYSNTLRSCGENVGFGFGTILNYSDISIGNNVNFGRFNEVGLVDFGDHVLIANRCTFLSGRHTHDFSDRETPIHLQKISRSRITVGSDVWVATGCIVMDSIGKGSVVGAGSVVTKPVPPYSVSVGNPARVVRER